MSRFLSTAALLLLLLLSGCFPALMVETPSIAGSVRSSATGLPLAGVTITYVDFPKVVALTQDDGTFTLPAIRRWEVAVIGTDHQPVRLLTLNVAGYKASQVGIYVGGTERYAFVLEPEGK
jgi:hypothetical protein